MNSNIGLVSLKELRKNKREAENSSSGNEAVGSEVENSPLTESRKRSSTPDISLNEKKKVKKSLVTKNKIPKLSFDNEDDDETDSITTLLKPKRDPSIDTSSLKTKKQLQKELEAAKHQQTIEDQQHAKIRSETMDFPFVYYDGTETPGSVEIKKGDPVWVILEKTRKNYKPFHRGTVDDIMLVKHSIIIPHVSLPFLL